MYRYGLRISDDRSISVAKWESCINDILLGKHLKMLILKMGQLSAI